MKINRTNYEDFLIQKLEGLLSTEQNAELDLFLHNNTDIRSEWEAFELTKLVPDESLVYEHKGLLKQKQSAGVIPIYRTMLFVTSIAASLLLVFFISQKYLINQPAVNNNQLAVNSNQSSVNSNQPAVINKLPSNNNVIVADNFQSNNKPFISKLTSNNINQPETQNQKPETINPKPETISYMKTLSPVAMKTYPRISYASFIWTKGLKVPHTPSRNVSEAGAWIQVASILGSEIIRLSGRGEKLNSAPIELKLIKKPVQLKINNPYLRFNKILSFKKKNSNNK